jgi:hypothetical protein
MEWYVPERELEKRRPHEARGSPAPLAPEGKKARIPAAGSQREHGRCTVLFAPEPKGVEQGEELRSGIRLTQARVGNVPEPDTDAAAALQLVA